MRSSSAANLIFKALDALRGLLPLEFDFGMTRKALAQRLLRFGHLAAALMNERVQALDLRFKAAAFIADRRPESNSTFSCWWTSMSARVENTADRISRMRLRSSM